MVGSFGYKIGRKVRLMCVQSDANLLWQILVREIYVLMKHYGSIEPFKKAFEQLVEAKNKPKKKAIEKCKIFTDLSVLNNTLDWEHLTRYCQHSFINILESGYVLNNGRLDDIFVFILDLNANVVEFYGTISGKKIEYERATIEEIIEFEEMPKKSFIEIIVEMQERFKKYTEKMEKVDDEVEKIENIIKKTIELGGDQNVLFKAKQLLDNVKWEKKKLELEYRYFYYRLDALNLIDHN
jgi:hypothetical protein